MTNTAPITHVSLRYHLREITAGSPATGNPDALNRRTALSALNSPDPVAFLASVARDPYRSLDARNTAHELLSKHVLPSKDPLHGTRREHPVTGERFGDWGRMGSHGGDYWWTYRCPNCMEAEALLNWTDEDSFEPEPRCPCGRAVPVPNYPGKTTEEPRSDRGARHAGPATRRGESDD